MLKIHYFEFLIFVKFRLIQRLKLNNIKKKEYERLCAALQEAEMDTNTDEKRINALKKEVGNQKLRYTMSSIKAPPQKCRFSSKKRFFR
jgi:hypothetical protein